MYWWIVFLYLFSSSISTNAQQLTIPQSSIYPQQPHWVQLMYNNAPIAVVEQAYYNYYQQHSFVKNQHTQYFKRWKRQLSRMPNWQGMTTSEHQHYQQKTQQYLLKNQQAALQKSPTATWQGIGPFDFDKNAASRSYACGAAHVYTVEKAPSNSDILYAGTATAGIWKSTDNGKFWSLMTKDLMITQVRALEIDHSNPQIVYASSDLDGKVYKTINGGSTWNIAGDPTFNTLQHAITDIVMHPNSNNIVLLASNHGLYRTTDSGASWTAVMSGIFQEIEFHPTQPNIVYAIQQIGNETRFYKSTDHGVSFVLKSNGWPVLNPGLDEQKRTEIAVSPAQPDRVYALLTGQAGFVSGLYGIFISNDAGETWTSSCCGAHLPNFPSTSNPNLMHWFADGTGNGGQHYYDLALAVSPTNIDSVLLAGVNLWFSSDGANSFTCPAQWNHSYKSNYVHADIHDIRYYDDEIWIACDGGIFYSTNNGQTFERRMEGIQGTDFWGFGAGFQDGEVMLGGTFHNGTLLKDNQVYENGWLSTDGGDNFRGFVHPVHERMVYSDYGKTILSGNRMIPNATSAFNHLPHAGRTIGFSGNIAFHPRLYNTLYSTEYYSLWKTTDNGLTWDLTYDFGSGLITSLEIAWSNPDIMYLNYHPSLPNSDRLIYRSADGGQSWTNITPDTSLIPNDRWVTYDITVSPTDANTLWIARVSKYEGSPILDGKQVYQSTDGGQSWTNITTSDLDGVYITNIEHQKGTNGGLYLGTRNAVYYKNSNMTTWDLFNNGLPVRTYSVQLVPYYKEGKLRNGTSRSVYECAFYESSPPVAQISVDKQQSNCPRDTFHFASFAASRSNATYNWQFQGGTPSTSTQANPKVVFANTGSFSVTLTVSDSIGTSTQILPNFITVGNECYKDTIPGYALDLNSTNEYVLTPPLNLQTNSITLSAWVKPDGIQPQFTGIITHENDSIPAGLLFGINNELIFQWNGIQWNWNSSLFVPVNEWSHVAVSITPDSATVYLNGIPSTYQQNLGPVHWMDGIAIGRYANWFSRNFIGEIDEVCIWDRALTMEEVRLNKHLTKYDINSPDLIHYYQFNANSLTVQDRSGTLHGTFVGGAGRTMSSAPVGGGNNALFSVQNNQTYSPNQGQASLAFSGTSPEGIIVANRLNVAPDQIAGNSLATDGYWIINNYGINNSFTPLDSLILHHQNINGNNAVDYTLYQRPSRAHGHTWSNAIDTCDALVNNQDFLFSTNLNLTQFGQFMIAADSSTLLNSKITAPIHHSTILLYPNPAQSSLTIEVPNEASYTITLFDLTGKKVLEEAFNYSIYRLSLPKLINGIYTYSIRSKTHIKNGLLHIHQSH